MTTEPISDDEVRTPAADAWCERHDQTQRWDRPDVTVRMPVDLPYAILQTVMVDTPEGRTEVLHKEQPVYANLRIGGVLFISRLDDLRQMLAAATESVEQITAYAVELGFEPVEVVR